jgi:hypothetical protein
MRATRSVPVRAGAAAAGVVPSSELSMLRRGPPWKHTPVAPWKAADSVKSSPHSAEAKALLTPSRPPR